MKTLIVSLLFACSLPCVAQSKLTPAEAQAVKEAARKIQMEELRKEMDAVVTKAQTNALARESNLAKLPKAEPLELLLPAAGPQRFYYNTNAWYRGLGLDIQMMELRFPGASTNFTPAQRALTNRAEPLPLRPY